MHSITEIEIEVELDTLSDEDVLGGLQALLGLGLDDLAKFSNPLLEGSFTLLVNADIFPDVEDTWDCPGEPGYAEITYIQARINGKLIEFPNILDYRPLEDIAEQVFVADRENPYC